MRLVSTLNLFAIAIATLSTTIGCQKDNPGKQDEQFDQIKANEALAVNKFTKFNVLTMNEADLTFEFATEESPIEEKSFFEWNEKWAENIYTNQNKKYRIPSIDEIKLLLPKYIDGINLVVFSDTSNAEIEEELPLNILGQENGGGKGKSFFKTSKETHECNYSEKLYYTYAIRFLGTNQAAAYKYSISDCEWGSVNGKIIIQIKALDKNAPLGINDIVDNDEFWSEDYIEYILPLWGNTSSSGLFGIGSMGDYWSSTSGGIGGGVQPEEEFSVSISCSVLNAFLGDSRKINTLNLRMVSAE